MTIYDWSNEISFVIAFESQQITKRERYFMQRKQVYQFSSAQSLSLSHVQLFATPWTTARQASLFITNSQSLLKLMSIESVMPSNHLTLCRPLLLPPSIFPSIRVFSNESALRVRWPKYWNFSFNISPSNEVENYEKTQPIPQSLCSQMFLNFEK